MNAAGDQPYCCLSREKVNKIVRSNKCHSIYTNKFTNENKTTFIAQLWFLNECGETGINFNASEWNLAWVSSHKQMS